MLGPLAARRGDVEGDGETLHPGQADGFCIFAAVALAVCATRPRRLGDAMFIEAGRAVADQAGRAKRPAGTLFPRQDAILEVERPRDVRAFIKALSAWPTCADARDR